MGRSSVAGGLGMTDQVSRVPRNRRQAKRARLVNTLKRLRSDTEAILNQFNLERTIDGSINWADLHCVAAIYVMDDCGFTQLRVEIQEVAPGEMVLITPVSEALKKRGWSDIDVVTEW